MKFKVFIGIDVSKSTIDVFVRNGSFHKVFKNNEMGFVEMVEWIMDMTGEVIACEVVFGFEPTGIYSRNLAVFLDRHGFSYSIIPGLELKRSMGIRRGKSDEIDSHYIAEYVYEKREKLKLCKLPSEFLEEIQKLCSYRERLVKERKAFNNRIGEYKAVFTEVSSNLYIESHAEVIRCLDNQIDKVEKEMLRLIKEDETLAKQFKLINSIKGVGPQTALTMIVLTGGFTLFDTWRRFASYAGTAPFPNESGRFKGKTKVSKLANQRIKDLLFLCAGTAIQHSPEMKIYYEKRVQEGKNRMSVLNIIRNKILSRIFAVVKRETPYVDTLKYAA